MQLLSRSSAAVSSALCASMAEWNRFKEDKKYTTAADTNVNPKHVGEPLRKLTLEDRLEIRRLARENSNKLNEVFKDEADVVLEDEEEEDDDTGELARTDSGAVSQPSQSGKRTASEDLALAGKRTKTTEEAAVAEDEFELEVVGATQVVVGPSGKDTANIVEDLDAIAARGNKGLANGTKDARKRKNGAADAVVSIGDGLSGAPSKDAGAVVELDEDSSKAAAAMRAGAERRARRKKAKQSSGPLTVPSPAPSPTPTSPDTNAEVEVLE